MKYISEASYCVCAMLASNNIGFRAYCVDILNATSARDVTNTVDDAQRAITAVVTTAGAYSGIFSGGFQYTRSRGSGHVSLPSYPAHSITSCSLCVHMRTRYSKLASVPDDLAHASSESRICVAHAVVTICVQSCYYSH